jgi:formate dehydrogenase subunit delta
MRIDSLLRMSQQIAANMRAFPHDDAVARIAAHLKSFWTPTMLAELRERAAHDPQSVDPVVREALARL